MTIIPASALSRRDLSILGFNTSAQVHEDQHDLQAYRRSLASIESDWPEQDVDTTHSGRTVKAAKGTNNRH